MENEILEQFRDEFLKNLNDHLQMYVTLGTKDESPMWYQFAGMEEKKLLFRSSQKQRLGFRINIPNETFEDVLFGIDFNQVYAYFKRLKYEHIRENWPTVFDEITGGQKESIVNFLKVC